MFVFFCKEICANSNNVQRSKPKIFQHLHSHCVLSGLGVAFRPLFAQKDLTALGIGICKPQKHGEVLILVFSSFATLYYSWIWTGAFF